MIIELELSDEVARLIEYIPNNMKSEILEDLIKQGIYNKSSIRADEAQVRANTNDINRVIKLIEELADGTIQRKSVSSSISETSATKEMVVEEKPVHQTTVISLTGLDGGDMLEDDLLDLLK